MEEVYLACILAGLKSTWNSEKSPVWLRVQTSKKLDCEFTYNVDWQQIQILSLESEIINSIQVHLWLEIIKAIMSGYDSNIFQHTTIFEVSGQLPHMSRSEK